MHAVGRPEPVRSALLRFPRSRGSALLATLCFAAVLAISLSTYLAVCYRSLSLSTRGMNSSRSLQMAEAGLEEALYALTSNTWTGWTTSGGNATKVVTGFTFEGGVTGQVTVTLTNYNYTTANFTIASTPTMTVLAVGRLTLGDGTIITRSLQSDIRPTQLFTNALGTTGGAISLVAGGTIDSYDSNVGNYSAGTKTYNAVVAGSSVDIDTAQVSGYAATTGSALQSHGTAKVYGPSTPVGTNIDLSRVSTTATQPTLDPVAPTGGSYLYDPGTGSSTLTNSINLNTAGVYRLDAISLSSGDTLTISAAVVLKVRYWVSLSSNARIRVTSTGSLQLHIDESNGFGLYMQGNGIVNDSQQPSRVSVLVGRSYSGSSTSVISTGNTFYGTIYLPNDSVTISSDFTMHGALVANSITLSTGCTPVVHYDTSLQRIGIGGFDTHAFSLVLIREV